MHLCFKEHYTEVGKMAKYSERTKKLLSKIMSEITTQKWKDPEYRRKHIEAFRKRKPHSLETRTKISKALKGRKFSDEHKMKLALKWKEKWGDKRKTKQKLINDVLMKRYNTTCAKCGKEINIRMNTPIGLDFHHIDGNSTNNAEENVLPLCRSCHRKLHSLSYKFLVEKGLHKEYIEYFLQKNNSMME
jgi:hypothetical protein